MPGNFEFRVIVFRPTPKTITLELVRLEGFITFSEFQFKFLPIDIIRRTRINFSRKKMRLNEKSINCSFNFIFAVEETLSEKCPEHIIIEQNSPQNPLFLLFFCGKYCPGLPNAPEPHYFLLFLSENNALDHIMFG